MTPERWQRVKNLFDEAIAIGPGQVQAFVSEAAAGDAELQQEVLRLVALHHTQNPIIDAVQPDPELLRQTIHNRAFRIGETVQSRFAIASFLGEGGMGEVYEARDLQLNEIVALKTVRLDQSHDAKARERFLQEIQMARRVTHPNVCRIHDLGETHRVDGQPLLFFTMERLHGEPLSVRLRREGPLPPAEVLAIARQLAPALDAAHAAGVLHRDLKPANVFLEPQPADIAVRAVITDFGLSRPHSGGIASETTNSAMCGTPAYMAPEQIEDGLASTASDLYSFGVMLYEMATGALPHESASPMALAVKKVRQAPPPPSSLGVTDLPASWDSALLRALAVRPEDRFLSARELVEALESPVSIAPGKPRRYWPLAVAATALIAGVVSWQLWQGAGGESHRPPAEALEWFQKGEAALREDAPYKASRLLERAVDADKQWPAAHARLAQAYWEADRIEDARQRMVHVSTLVPDRSRLAARERALIEGVQLLLVRDFDTAAARFGQLRDTAGELERAKALALANRTLEAVALFEQLARQAPRDASVWLQLAIRQAQQQNLTPALDAFQKAEELFRLDGNLEGVTSVILRRSKALQKTKRVAESRGEVEKALQLASDTGAVHQQAQALAQLASLASLAGQVSEARALSDRVLTLASNERMPALAVSALDGTGSSFQAQLNWAEAETYFRRAMELAGRAGLSAGDAIARFHLAQTLIRQNRTAEGLQLAAAAIKYFEAGNYRENLVASYGLIADAAIQDGRNDEAVRAAEEYLRQAERANLPMEVARARARVGHMMLVRADFPGAIQQAALLREQYLRDGRHLQAFVSLTNQILYHLQLGDAAGARSTIQAAKEQARRVGKDAQPLLWRISSGEALVAALEGRPAQGLPHLVQARRDAGANAATIALLDLAEAALLVQAGQPAQALRLATRADTYYAAKGAPTERVHASCRLATIWLASGKVAEAGRRARDGMRVSEESGQAEPALFCALTAWAAARKARSPEEPAARREFEQRFAAVTATWPEAARKQYEVRPDHRWFIN